MTAPMGIVEHGADFVRLALDYVFEGLHEIESALPGVETASEAQLDAAKLKRPSALMPDVEGHPC